MSTPLIYAELLSNIRQISVLAALPSPSTAQTHITLSPSRTHLQLHHAGTTTSLHLPASISPTYTPLPPQPGLLTLSLRIPLAAPPPRDSDSTAPWAATDLSPSSGFVCRGCGQVVVRPGKIASWRDLPSENWADMMDFWHCHKPETGDARGGEELGNKGYAANARVVAQKGVGKVGVMYFLVSEEDCEGIEISHTNPPTLLCTNPRCRTPLGASDPLTGHRLNKYTLSLLDLPTPSSRLPSPPLTSFLLPHLTSLTSLLGVSKFIIRLPTNRAIYTWLFAPSLTISLSSAAGPQHASKLLYRLVAADEAEKLLDAPDASVEEVDLPVDAAKALLRALEGSNRALPEGARRFGEWSVGVLERG